MPRPLRKPMRYIFLVILIRKLIGLLAACALIVVAMTPPMLGSPDEMERARLRGILQPVTVKNARSKMAAAGAGITARRAAAGGNNSIKVLDVQSVALDSPSRAIKTISPPKRPPVVACDVLIAGGGVGGVAAALQAALSGLKVCLTEETDWLGGQMTAQGVSALDENYLVETSGSTLKYQQLRDRLRAYYRQQFRLTREAAAQQYFNPGNCWVSVLSFEPAVAVAKIEEMLRPLEAQGTLTVHRRTKPVAARMSGGKVRSVIMANLDTGETMAVRPKICLDATELGALLPMTGTAYRAGAESSLDTGEPHAPLARDENNVQDFVYPFAVEFRPGENHTIARPPLYDGFKEQGAFSFYGYKMFRQSSLADPDGSERQVLPFWTYRRLLDCSNWTDPPFGYDVAMINWMSNDLSGQNIIDQPDEVAAERLAMAKALSLGFLYWLQTEAPRDEGGHGYPELRLVPQVMGSQDGLSKYPYIRESRRIRPVRTILEQDIAAATNRGARARFCPDSVGIGFYPIDIHGRQDLPGAAQATRPFQLPLGALIPEKRSNLIASAKNIGTTHITNGAYRLHPVEWAVGEAAGHLAAFCARAGVPARRVLENKTLLRKLQSELVGMGVPIYWYDDVPVSHPAFPAIQFLAITQVMPGAPEHLHFRPADPLTREEAASALACILKLKARVTPRTLPADVAAESDSAAAIAACVRSGLIAVSPDRNFRPADPVTWRDLEPAGRHRLLKLPIPPAPGATPTRADFAMWLFPAAICERLLGKL